MPAPEKKFPWVAYLVLVILLVAGAGGSLYVLNKTVFKPQPSPSPLIVKEGDNVTVNYIGMFGSGIDQGKVFDTSLLSVANDNAAWPKALSFSYRGASGYTPLSAHVGPQSYGSYTSLITGFWTAMVGLQGNQTITTVIPPKDGYGLSNPSKVLTYPLVQSMPMAHIYTPAQFGSAFSGIAAQSGTIFTDPHWGWTDYVFSVNATAVVVIDQPTVGETIHPFDWSDTILSVNSGSGPNGTITFRNNLTPQSVGEVTGPDWQNGGSTYFLTNVNPTAGTYTLDFNSEVTGNTLIFQITVVSILPPPSH